MNQNVLSGAKARAFQDAVCDEVNKIVTSYKLRATSGCVDIAELVARFL